MIDRIRVGLLGCSTIAARSILPAIKRNLQFELIAVGARSHEKAQRFAETFSCRGGGYGDILADPSIDAVYVSLPVGLHYEWGKEVLISGKHLLLEKTFTHSFSTAQLLLDLAQKQQLVAMEAVPYVFHPLFRRVREIVKSGELGTVRHIEAFFGFPYLPEGDIRHRRELGGGAILDALIYPLSFCLHIGGDDYLKYFHHALYDDQRNIDVRGFLQIDWPACSAQIAYGFGFAYRNTYTIWGESAYLTSERVFSRPPDLAAEIRIVRQGKADHFGLMLDAFASKIHGVGDSGLNQGHDILTRMKIISTMYERYGCSRVGEHK
jgi:NDP-hexose-3-ketoreductase